MKDVCTAITTLFAMILACFLWLIVFSFNVVLAAIGIVILVISYPFIWIYSQFKKWKST